MMVLTYKNNTQHTTHKLIRREVDFFMKKNIEVVTYMLLGALFLCIGIWTGSEISGKNSYHAGSEEQMLIAKDKVIDSIVTDTVRNKFLGSRKANELANVDIGKLKKAIKKGVTIIVVPENDVFESPILNNKDQAKKNKANGVIADCAYVAKSNQIIISINAPNGVLIDQLNKALVSK